jgi:hypothetical protein
MGSRAGLVEWLATSRVVRVLWWLLILATAANGAVVGYGVLWFQLFGESADRSDCLVSAGGYGTAALVLLVAAVGVAGLRGPRCAGWTAVALAVALLVLAAGSASRAADLPAGRWDDSPLDGVGGVLCLPWAWVLVAAGIAGTLRLCRRGGTDRASR